jgi:hypothetical protein
MRYLIGAAAAALLAATTSAIAEDLVIPEDGYVVSNDFTQLPAAVAAKRDALIKIVEAGDISALKPILDADQTTVSFGGPEDRIAYLKEASKDGEGLEMLALLGDILEAPFAAADGGDGSAVYVWPYLAELEGIGEVVTAADRVEGIRIAGVENFKEIQEFGAWIYWRAYIGEGGQLQAFVAGD